MKIPKRIRAAARLSKSGVLLLEIDCHPKRMAIIRTALGRRYYDSQALVYPDGVDTFLLARMSAEKAAALRRGDTVRLLVEPELFLD